MGTPVQKLISRDRLSATIPPSDPTYRSQGRKPRRHEKPMVVHARKAPHGSHSLLIRKFRIVQPHRQRRRRYRPPCQRHPPLCRFTNNKSHDLRSSVKHPPWILCCTIILQHKIHVLTPFQFQSKGLSIHCYGHAQSHVDISFSTHSLKCGHWERSVSIPTF